VVLDVTATDGNGKELFKKGKTWFQIGVDTDRFMRYGAWQIKEFIDFTLPPLQTQTEQYLMHFDTDTEKVNIAVQLWYYISGGKGEVVYSFDKTLEYEIQ
jgi:hypothetical protein